MTFAFGVEPYESHSCVVHFEVMAVKMANALFTKLENIC